MQLENEKKVVTIINSDITGSRFKNVRAEQLTFQCSNLSGMKMNDVNLTGMDISDANLSGLVIDGAQWGGALFLHLGYSDKDQPELAQIESNPVQFSHCSLKEGVFAECNLTNVKLEDCDISGLEINGINIEKLIRQHASAAEKMEIDQEFEQREMHRVSEVACINLPVSNVEVSTNWYVNHLGSTIMREPQRFPDGNANSLIRLGKAGPSVWLRESTEQVSMNFSINSGSNLTIFELRTENMNDFYEQLKRENVNITEIEDHGVCGKTFKIIDPDGNKFTILEC
ncbi:pentapeptide repeat-containing protein [Paenibacillus eucommiae]|nr:pentapeptide repeat-containing protein [Paenibacillus eucommiae]